MPLMHTGHSSRRRTRLSQLAVAAAAALLFHTCRFCGLFAAQETRLRAAFSALSTSLGGGAPTVQALSDSYRVLTDAAD